MSATSLASSSSPDDAVFRRISMAAPHLYQEPLKTYRRTAQGKHTTALIAKSRFRMSLPPSLGRKCVPGNRTGQLQTGIRD